MVDRWFLQTLAVLGFPEAVTPGNQPYFVSNLEIVKSYLRAIEMIKQAAFAQKEPIHAVLRPAKYADSYQLTYPEMGHWQFLGLHVSPEWDRPDYWRFPDRLRDVLVAQRRFPEWYVACLRERMLPALYRSLHGPSTIHLLPFYKLPITLVRHAPFASVLEDIGGLYV